MTSEQMEVALTKLIKEFLPPVMRRLAELEAKVAELEKAGGKKQMLRKPLTYDMYLRIMELRDAQFEPVSIARKTGVPYTTVRRYLSLPEDKVEELKRKLES